MSDIIKAEFQGYMMSFNNDGWFDATTAAAKFGKRPVDWLKQVETDAYISALCKKYEVTKTHFVKTKKGGDVSTQGTWFHPKLGVIFARWLHLDFAIWCDEQIDNLIHQQLDHKKLRHASAAGYKLMDNILMLTREESGKETLNYHYSNEALLVNWALSGKREKINRDDLTYIELDILAKLQAKNTVLISRDVEYQKRKIILEQFAIDLRSEVKFLMA